MLRGAATCPAFPPWRDNFEFEKMKDGIPKAPPGELGSEPCRGCAVVDAPGDAVAIDKIRTDDRHEPAGTTIVSELLKVGDRVGDTLDCIKTGHNVVLRFGLRAQ